MNDVDPAVLAEAAPVMAPPSTIVIFGAAGDLTKRLVVPALYNLVRAKRLPDGFRLTGIDIADQTTEQWRQNLTDMMNEFITSGVGEFRAASLDHDAWAWLTGRMTYMRGDFSDAATFQTLKAHLADTAATKGTIGNVLFYLAVADRFFGPVVEQLGRAELVAQTESAWRRVVIEKPFGHDLDSAIALNKQVGTVLDEDQTYRADHFLGKETVQNILVMRFANGLFEPLWNRDHIDHVQITAAETVGVEQRGPFYEKTGALRDMVPNHLFQLLAMIAMEPPISFDAEAVRSKKTEVFAAIHPVQPHEAVRGQYDAGTVLGQPVRAYRHEPRVALDSNTETFVALKLMIDNWRWAGVPFYLRTGKYMSGRSTEIAIHFRQAPFALFRDTPVDRLPPNTLVIRVSPDEGISITFSAKRPGPDIKIAGVAMDFAYRDYFEALSAVGYETLLYDCMVGDRILFQRGDTVEAAWRAVQPVIDAWAAEKPRDFPNYAAGTDGPDASTALLARDGRQWRPVPRPKPSAPKDHA